MTGVDQDHPLPRTSVACSVCHQSCRHVLDPDRHRGRGGVRSGSSGRADPDRAVREGRCGAGGGACPGAAGVAAAVPGRGVLRAGAVPVPAGRLPGRVEHPDRCPARGRPGRSLAESAPLPAPAGRCRATRTSPPRRPSSSTCTRGTTRASGCGRATRSSRCTPSPPSRPAPDAIPPARPPLAGPGGARIRAPGRAGAAGSPGCPHREGVRLHLRHHRDRPVHGTDGPGHERRTVQECQPGVRHRGQRLRPPRQEGGPAAAWRLPERHHDPHTGARLLAEPSGDRLLHHPEKVISHNDFASTAQLAATLLAFIDRYNQTARPFNWKYTAADLARLLDQINAHEKPASLPQAA